MASPALLRHGLTTCLVMMAIGCGPKRVPVEGNITYDGEPLPGATISLVPEGTAEAGGYLPNGFSDKAGRFQLWTVNDAGAFPGRYKVVVSKKVWPPTITAPNEELMEMSGEMIEILPETYTDVEKTPLRLEVSRVGTKELHLTLTSEKR